MATIKDVVLIYFEDQALSFARIEDIRPDVKPGWFQVKLLLLEIPLQVVTWILREAYIGGEVFTMGGNRIRLEPVVCPEEAAPSDGLEVPPDETAGVAQKPGRPAAKGKVISLSEMKKKH